MRILGAPLGGRRKAVLELGAVLCREAGWRQHCEFGTVLAYLFWISY